MVARGGLRTKTMSWCPGGKKYTRGMLVIATGERGANTVFVVSGVGKKYTRGKLVIAHGERGANTVFVVSGVGKKYTRGMLVIARSPIAHNDVGWGGGKECENAQYVGEHNNS